MLSSYTVRHASSVEDAALIAWDITEENNLSMPNRSWMMKTWDTWEGQYETNPITDHMIRGSAGAHPRKVEFVRGVTDALTEVRRDDSGLFARASVPYTKEPGNPKPKLDIFRGKDNRLVVEYVKDAKFSAVDEFKPKLEKAISKAEDEGELDALTKLLEEKIQEIKGSNTKRQKVAVD